MLDSLVESTGLTVCLAPWCPPQFLGSGPVHPRRNSVNGRGPSEDRRSSCFTNQGRSLTLSVLGRMSKPCLACGPCVPQPQPPTRALSSKATKRHSMGQGEAVGAVQGAGRWLAESSLTYQGCRFVILPAGGVVCKAAAAHLTIQPSCSKNSCL